MHCSRTVFRACCLATLLFGAPSARAQTGACCHPDLGCTHLSSAMCAQAGGYWWGSTVVCAANPCRAVGACCATTGVGSCVLTQDAGCTAPGLQWRGAGTACSPFPCPGACCDLNTGGCTLDTSNGCDARPGHNLLSAWTCSPQPCTDLIYACCAPSGECSVRVAHLPTTSPSDCAFTFHGMSCSPEPCPPEGACCTAGGCAVRISAACAGSWRGSGTTCSPSPCGGACCFGQSCSLMTSLIVCVGSGGNWRGLSTTCSPSNPCITMGGACCFFDGSCSVFSSGLSCEVGVGGDWQGPGSTCSPANPCPPAGACCNGISCLFRIQSECLAPQIWRGAGTACFPNICQGACCETDGMCYILAAGECAPERWHVGLPCVPDPCGPQAGACCIGTTCWLTRPTDCLGAFRGLGTTCTFSTCCDADFNRSGQLSVQDIFDFLAAYLTGNLAADFNRSGGLSVQDLFDFLEGYFEGCG